MPPKYLIEGSYSAQGVEGVRSLAEPPSTLRVVQTLGATLVLSLILRS